MGSFPSANPSLPTSVPGIYVPDPVVPTGLAWQTTTPSTSPLVVRGLNAQAGSNVTSLTYSYPAGTTGGDAIVVLQNSTSQITTNNLVNCSPQPWALFAQVAVPAGGHDNLVGHAVGFEPSVGAPTPSCTVQGAGIFNGILVACGPASGPAAIIRTDGTSSVVIGSADAASLTIPAGTFVTGFANELVLCMVEHAAGGVLSTNSPGWTDLGGQGSQHAFSTVVAAPGNVPAITITDANGTSGKGWAAFQLALLPAGS